MKDFYFEQSIAEYSAKQEQQKIITYLILGLVILGTLSISDKDAWPMIVFAIVLIFFIFFRENKIIKQIKKSPKNEKWQISLSDLQLSWQSPKSLQQILAETSFTVQLDKIKAIQSTHNISDDLEYRLAHEDDSFLELKTHSHIDMNLFIKALTDRGINYQHI